MGAHGCTGAAAGVTGSGAAVDHDPATDGHGGGYLHPYLARLAAHCPRTAARVPQPLQACGAARSYIRRDTCPCTARAHTFVHARSNTQTARETERKREREERAGNERERGMIRDTEPNL
jgi:hypothetical protein